MKYKLAFLFTQAPYGNSRSREGLEALLAASAFCDEQDIAVYFLGDGIFNLLPNQQAEAILQKDIGTAFKLLELYELPNLFVCQQDLAYYQLETQALSINCQKIDRTLLFQQLHNSNKLLTF